MSLNLGGVSSTYTIRISLQPLAQARLTGRRALGNEKIGHQAVHFVFGNYHVSDGVADQLAKEKRQPRADVDDPGFAMNLIGD